MGNSLMVGCAKMGLNFTACAPRKYQPDAALVEQCKAIAAETGAAISFEEDPAKAQRRRRPLHRRLGVHGRAGRGLGRAYQRPGRISNQPKPDGHCRPQGRVHALPARLPRPQDHCGREMGERFGRDAMEVTDEVFEGPRASFSTRPRTGCTPSRLSWRPRWL